MLGSSFKNNGSKRSGSFNFRQQAGFSPDRVKTPGKTGVSKQRNQVLKTSIQMLAPKQANGYGSNTGMAVSLKEQILGPKAYTKNNLLLTNQTPGR